MLVGLQAVALPATSLNIRQNVTWRRRPEGQRDDMVYRRGSRVRCRRADDLRVLQQKFDATNLAPPLVAVEHLIPRDRRVCDAEFAAALAKGGGSLATELIFPPFPPDCLCLPNGCALLAPQPSSQQAASASGAKPNWFTALAARSMGVFAGTRIDYCSPTFTAP